MKNNQNNSLDRILSNPVFLLAAIIMVFAGIFYFFGGQKSNLVSSYIEDEKWKNSEDAKGPSDAKVKIVEYGDYECPACGVEYETVEQILSEYKDKIEFIYRHFPLSQHKYALKASIAAECAGEQGKFWEMHDKLYRNRENLDEKSLKKFAQDLGMDGDKFNQCLDNNGYIEKINKNKEQGTSDNISHTPTFFINGKELKNSQGDNFLPVLGDFKKEIDFELSK